MSHPTVVTRPLFSERDGTRHRVTYILQPRLQRIGRFDFICESAWAILEGVVETERVGSVRDGRLYGCFSRDKTKRGFLVHSMSQERRKRGWSVQTMVEQVSVCGADARPLRVR